MKITSHNGRVDKSGRHNDRNFNVDLATHINKEESKDNLYYVYNGDYEKTFREIELDFYREHFAEGIEAQNNRNKEHRHRGRNKTIEQYYSGRYTQPEDKILQIGDKDSHATPEELWACAMEYKDRFNDIYGDHCKILDMALHVDEATPHVHVRRVWIAEDEDGRETISQSKALEQLGIMPPDMSLPIGKYNNSKITFTHAERALFRDIAIEKGLDIDPEEPSKSEHLTVNQYKEKAAEENLGILEREYEKVQRDIDEIKDKIEKIDSIISDAEDFFANDPMFQGRLLREVEEAKKKSRAERIQSLIRIYQREVKDAIDRASDFDKAAVRSEVDAEVKSLKDFLERNNLLNEYEEEMEHRDTAEATRDKSQKGFYF